MSIQKQLRLWSLTGVLLLSALTATAQTSYLLTLPSTVDPDSFAATHNLTVVRDLHNGSNSVYLVSSPSYNVSQTETDVDSDLRTSGFEPEAVTQLPELNGATQATLTQSTSGILESLVGRTLVTFFGSTVPSNYLSQPATSITRLYDARTATNLTGTGVIAIIDTGVDPTHPALRAVLVPGFNFTTGTVDTSELNDLPAATAASLAQSTSGILEAQNVVIMNPATGAILDQSTSGILEGVAPQEFGHGTMVAGVVHLVAPTAKIMPLKAFHSDGSSKLSDIINAIYYAADNGANVISMSFSMSTPSPALQTAIQYALGKNVAVIAASGNDGLKTLVYPASFGGVEGIGSTSNTDVRSTFSNYGSGVTMFAAPGEGVITTYPGSNYAAAWGTSFSTPFVAGAASLVLQARPASKPGDIINALSKAKQISDLGYGRIDFYQALTTLVGSTSSGTSGTSGSTSGGPTP